MYVTWGKRLWDILLAGLGLVLAGPILLGAALMIRIRFGAPALFRQTRPGRDGLPFEILKFRTMTNAVGEKGRLLPDEDRLSPFGRFLRATSIDELPELLNVLAGDMSVVGPRPLLMEYLPLYGERERRRHEVRPGITGWAQVNGRNALSWEEKFELDVWYVDHVSLALDLRIILRTVIAVLGRRGISAESHATMPPFRGLAG